VTSTAAANDNSVLRAVDATSASSTDSELQAVCHTDRNLEWPKSAEVVTTYAT
jgi:hypothetical protein